MKAAIRRFHSPDIYNLDKPDIDETKQFCVLVQAMLGPAGGLGEESFDLIVSNPLWVAEQTNKGFLYGRHLLIVSRFNLADLQKFWSDAIEDSVGGTWEEVGGKLSRYGKWEFEDYWANDAVAR